MQSSSQAFKFLSEHRPLMNRLHPCLSWAIFSGCCHVSSSFLTSSPGVLRTSSSRLPCGFRLHKYVQLPNDGSLQCFGSVQTLELKILSLVSIDLDLDCSSTLLVLLLVSTSSHPCSTVFNRQFLTVAFCSLVLRTRLKLFCGYGSNNLLWVCCYMQHISHLMQTYIKSNVIGTGFNLMFTSAQ